MKHAGYNRQDRESNDTGDQPAACAHTLDRRREHHRVSNGDLFGNLLAGETSATPNQDRGQQGKQKNGRPLRFEEIVAERTYGTQEQAAEERAAGAADAAHERSGKRDQTAFGAVLAKGTTIINGEDECGGACQCSAQYEGAPDGTVAVDADHLRQLFVLRDRPDGAAEPRAQKYIGCYRDKENGSDPDEEV